MTKINTAASLVVTMGLAVSGTAFAQDRGMRDTEQAGQRTPQEQPMQPERVPGDQPTQREHDSEDRPMQANQPTQARELPSVSARGTDQRYTVQKGDTLGKIAERFLGDGNQWKVIARANQIEQPEMLEVGTRLVIPSDAKRRPDADPRSERRMDADQGMRGERDLRTRRSGETTERTR